MTFDDLRAEYLEQRIGPLLLKEFTSLARGIVRNYSPQVYLRAASWQDGLEDFVQEFVVEVLLGDGQLDYVMDVASTESDFRNLLSRQIRRFLAKKRQRTVVDNLLDRSRELVRREPFEYREQSRSWEFKLSELASRKHVGSDADLQAIAVELTLFPVIRSESTERAPIVYSGDTLRAVLELLARKAGGWVSVSDLDTIFRHALTFLLPGDLTTSEVATSFHVATGVSAEDELIVDGGVKGLLEVMKGEELAVLKLKLRGAADVDIAKALGISRPTVQKRKDAALKRLEFVLEDLDERLQHLVVDRLSIHLASQDEL